jgi:hypothetical protein
VQPCVADLEAVSVTSMCTGVSDSDAAERSESPSASLRTPANTRNPLRSNINAQARPMPVDDPVMTTDFMMCSLVDVMWWPPHRKTRTSWPR